MLVKKDKKEAKHFAVVARYIYSHSDDSYTELKVFEIRSHAIEYMDAMNTAAKSVSYTHLTLPTSNGV